MAKKKSNASRPAGRAKKKPAARAKPRAPRAGSPGQGARPREVPRPRDPLDAATYVRVPQLDVPSTVSLAIKLLGLVPSSTLAEDTHEIAGIMPAAEALRGSVLALQREWRARSGQSAPRLRPLDLALDGAWSALVSRLEPWAALEPVEALERDARRAAELIAVLFPGRLDFTILELSAEWAESDKRLAMIAERGLRADLARLAGAPFVARVETTHAALGLALGLAGEPVQAPVPAIDLSEALRATRRAIAGYALQLVAAHMTASETLAAAIVPALAPIAEARSSRGDREAPPPDVDPETPVPPVEER